MAAAPATCPASSALLNLPVELRLDIYAHAILRPRNITIGTANLVRSPADILHRRYALAPAPHPGIPQNHAPVVLPHYSPTLLSAGSPAPMDAAIPPSEAALANTQPAYHTLSRVNKQIRNELESHFSIPAQRQTSLFVQYPGGLHVLHTTTPQLLQQSRSVHIAGTYLPRTFSASRAARVASPQAPAQTPLPGDAPESERQLEGLIKACFGPRSTPHIILLELRMYYPGEDSYSTVWGDDASPIVVALRNIALAEIEIEVWRGSQATGVRLCARPSTKKRIVSTVWRKLEESRAEQGSWIVDEQWPAWQPAQDAPVEG